MGNIYINKQQLIEALDLMPIMPEITGFAIKECIKIMIEENHFHIEEIEKEENQ